MAGDSLFTCKWVPKLNAMPSPSLSSSKEVPNVLAAPIIDFPHGTILIPAEPSAAEQRNKRTGAHYLWARPPAVESAKAAVRVMLPLQWPLTRRMDEWHAAYWAFYDLGIALGPISRFKEPPLSSPNGAVKLLYGSVASAMGAFVAGGLTVPPKPGGRRLDEVVTRWRLVADGMSSACARSRGSGLCEGKVLYRGDPVGTLAIRRYVR